jgi:hypothetical protein
MDSVLRGKRSEMDKREAEAEERERNYRKKTLNRSGKKILRHLCRCHLFRANQAPAGRGSKPFGKSSSSIPAQQEKGRQKRGRRSFESQLGQSKI